MIDKLKGLARKVYREGRHLSVRPRTARYFMLIAQERTGSTLLSDLLSFHPAILMDRHDFLTIDTWPQRYTEGHTVFSSKPVRGFKVKVVHAPLYNSVKSANEWFQKTSETVHIIRLSRKNKLRQALSACIADKKEKLHIWSDSKRNGRGKREYSDKERVDTERVIEKIKYFLRMDRFEKASLKNVQHLEVVYEEDLLSQDSHQSTANRVFRYLDLPSSNIDTRLKRTSKSSIRDMIENYKDLIRELDNNGFRYFLDDFEGTY